MATELTVPQVGESITEVLVVEWLKKAGDSVEMDEPIAVIETDKATLEIPSPVAGRLEKILKKKDEWAKVGEAIAEIAEGESGKAPEAAKSAKAGGEKASVSGEAKKPQAEAKGEGAEVSVKGGEPGEAGKPKGKPYVMPAAARMLAEHNLSPDQVKGTGPGGRILKEDVERHLEEGDGSAPPTRTKTSERDAKQAEAEDAQEPGREEESVPMSPLRRAVAQRLVEAQQTAALLTTFNEIDMSEVKALRKEYGDAFEKKYGVRLGYVSFFVKSTIEALKAVPGMNAVIRDKNIVYHNYYDIGIAVGGGKGLVVPILRNAERKSFADVEREIADLANRARANKIELSELQGGTFTISNGGVYGSLLSTPIVNPPQSGILGLHAIQDRPVARKGEIIIRPMMYVAVTYDHRIVDGREAVMFLRRIKDLMENPSRMLLEI